MAGFTKMGKIEHAVIGKWNYGRCETICLKLILRSIAWMMTLFIMMDEDNKLQFSRTTNWTKKINNDKILYIAISFFYLVFVIHY